MLVSLQLSCLVPLSRLAWPRFGARILGCYPRPVESEEGEEGSDGVDCFKVNTLDST